MLLSLVKTVLKGPDRWVSDDRTGLKVVKLRDNLLIYRHGIRKMWLDLELRYVVSWNLSTQAEVAAFNRVLQLAGVDSFYEFIRSGRLVLLNAGGHFYRSEEYDELFGHLGRDPSHAGPRDQPA
jgi:hypothetical protein